MRPPRVSSHRLKVQRGEPCAATLTALLTPSTRRVCGSVIGLPEVPSIVRHSLSWVSLIESRQLNSLLYSLNAVPFVLHVYTSLKKPDVISTRLCGAGPCAASVNGCTLRCCAIQRYVGF